MTEKTPQEIRRMSKDDLVAYVGELQSTVAGHELAAREYRLKTETLSRQFEKLRKDMAQRQMSDSDLILISLAGLLGIKPDEVKRKLSDELRQRQILL